MATSIVKQVVNEGFTEAKGLRAQAEALPRWRWLKRQNLRDKAWAIEQAMTLVWNDHKHDR